MVTQERRAEFCNLPLRGTLGSSACRATHAAQSRNGAATAALPAHTALQQFPGYHASLPAIRCTPSGTALRSPFDLPREPGAEEEGAAATGGKPKKLEAAAGARRLRRTIRWKNPDGSPASRCLRRATAGAAASPPLTLHSRTFRSASGGIKSARVCGFHCVRGIDRAEPLY